MEKPDTTVILNCLSSLVNYYLEKGFYIIANNSKQLSITSNDVKLRIHAIDKLKTDYVMAKTTAIYLVANIKKELNIQSDLYFIYKQNFYHDKKYEINKLFVEYHLPLLNYINNPSLIQEWKRNLDTSDYEKHLNKEKKLPSNKKGTNRHGSIT